MNSPALQPMEKQTERLNKIISALLEQIDALKNNNRALINYILKDKSGYSLSEKGNASPKLSPSLSKNDNGIITRSSSLAEKDKGISNNSYSIAEKDNGTTE